MSSVPRGVYDHRPLSLAPSAATPSAPPQSATALNPSAGATPGSSSGSHPHSAHPPHPSAHAHSLNGLMHPGAQGAPPSGPPGPPGSSSAAAAAAALAAGMGGPGAPVVGVGMGGGVPIAPPHPSAARLNDLLEFVKAEFEQVAGEGGVLRAQREEYEAMIHNHASELNAMRAMAYDLERKYHDDKRVLQEENSRLQEEISRLRQQLDTSRTSISSSAAGAGPTPGPLGRPTLPSLMASTPVPPPGARPSSSGPSSLFGGGAGPHGEREREYPGYAGANARDGPPGEHPNKRARPDEDDRRKGPTSAAPQRHGSASLPYAGSRPSSTGPAAPPLHHPSPLPPPSAQPTLPPISHSAPSPAAPPPPPAAATPAKDEKPVEVTSFDPETAPKDLKKEGSDWMTMFNPNVKRVLDVGLVHTLVHDSVVCCVRFSPDGKMLATGCNRNTTLYDTKTGAKISTLFDESSGAKADNYIRSASFSPDGKFLATGSEDRIVRIWNLAQKRISQVFQGHKSEIYSLVFSPDGRRLVSGSGDKTARMWDLETGSCVFTLAIDDITIAENGPVDAGVTSVVLSPDGKFLAAGSLDTVVRIWDAETGQLLDKLKGHKDSVYSVAFSPDGKFLVSGSLDKTLKMWDMATLRATLAAAGKDAPVGEGGKTTCLTTLQGHKDYVLSVDISPDGAWIVSGSKDRGVQFWDPKTAKAQFMLQGHKNSVISVAVSDVGGLVATGSGDWSARIWSYERIA